MQIQSVATYLGPEQGFTFISYGLAVVEQGGYLRLLYAQRTDNRLGAITLETGVTPTAPAPGAPVIGAAPGQDMVVQDTATLPRIFVFSDYDGLLRHTTIGTTGLPGTTNGTNTDQGYLSSVVAMEMFDRGATDIAM